MKKVLLITMTAFTLQQAHASHNSAQNTDLKKSLMPSAPVALMAGGSALTLGSTLLQYKAEKERDKLRKADANLRIILEDGKLMKDEDGNIYQVTKNPQQPSQNSPAHNSNCQARYTPKKIIAEKRKSLDDACKELEVNGHKAHTVNKLKNIYTKHKNNSVDQDGYTPIHSYPYNWNELYKDLDKPVSSVYSASSWIGAGITCIGAWLQVFKK